MVDDVRLENKGGKKTRHWLDKHQIQGLSALLGKTVRGVRIHTDARRKLYDHKRHRKCNRLSVMIADDLKVHLKDDELSSGLISEVLTSTHFPPVWKDPLTGRRNGVIQGIKFVN